MDFNFSVHVFHYYFMIIHLSQLVINYGITVACTYVVMKNIFNLYIYQYNKFWYSRKTMYLVLMAKFEFKQRVTLTDKHSKGDYISGLRIRQCQQKKKKKKSNKDHYLAWNSSSMKGWMLRHGPVEGRISMPIYMDFAWHHL